MSSAPAASMLRIVVGGAQLRAPSDDDVESLARRVAVPAAILPIGDEHFVVWLSGRASEDIERRRIARLRANRDLTTRPGWTLDLAVSVDDEPVGVESDPRGR